MKVANASEETQTIVYKFATPNTFPMYKVPIVTQAVILNIRITAATVHSDIEDCCFCYYWDLWACAQLCYWLISPPISDRTTGDLLHFGFGQCARARPSSGRCGRVSSYHHSCTTGAWLRKDKDENKEYNKDKQKDKDNYKQSHKHIA